MRSPAVSFTSDLPLVDLEFTNLNQTPYIYRFTIDSADLRPADAEMLSSMMVFQGYDVDGGDDTLFVTLRNIEISGRSSVIPIIPPFSQQSIRGAGIEVGLKQSCQGRISLENVSVRDARGEGFYGLVMQNESAGFFSCSNTSFRYNGDAAVSSPYMASVAFGAASFEQSGLHLEVHEEGAWTVDDGAESHFDDNYRHGVILESSSNDDEVDGFPLADFDLCTFMRNGLDLDASVRGHGVYAHMLESEIELHLHRSAASSNHTSGVNMLFDFANTVRRQRLVATNSTFSRNLGIGPALYGPAGAFPLETNPIAIISLAPANSFTTNLSQITVSDNPTPYALSLFGSTSDALEALWPAGSTSRIDNCVLNANGFTSTGGVFSDQAYYPEPPFSGTNEWTEMFLGTDFSNLGRIKGIIVPQYTSVQGNYYDPPLLTSFTFMGSFLGDVFPSTSSPLFNMGMGTRFATEGTDNRGPGNPRIIGVAWDTGAFEVQ